jgi:hypothetical protein
VITKVDGTGGLVSPATCKAQLLWEVGDPRRYLTPDVVADFTDIAFETAGADEVRPRTGSRRWSESGRASSPRR